MVRGLLRQQQQQRPEGQQSSSSSPLRQQAAHSADDDVEVVDTTSAELKESLKETQRLAKVYRVQTEARRSNWGLCVLLEIL